MMRSEALKLYHPNLWEDQAMLDLLKKIEYALRKDSLTDHERIASARALVCAAISKAEYAPQALAATPAVGGEPVAWRIYCTTNGATGYLYTERLPFEPGPGVRVRHEPEPLYAAPPASPLRPTEEQIDAALNAWFKSPPSETDQGLERSMKAALIAADALRPPASPLRGREDLAPSPCSDLSIGELIEWLDNPQWTNGYLNSDAANHMSAAAELIERLVSSAPPEQPAAWQCHAKLRPEVSDCMWPDCGCEPRSTEIIAALVKQGWTPPQPAAAPVMEREEIARAFLYETGMFDNKAEIKANPEHRLVKAAYAAADRLLTAPDKQPLRYGEPVWPNNDEANDLDKGSDA